MCYSADCAVLISVNATPLWTARGTPSSKPSWIWVLSPKKNCLLWSQCTELCNGCKIWLAWLDYGEFSSLFSSTWCVVVNVNICPYRTSAMSEWGKITLDGKCVRQQLRGHDGSSAGQPILHRRGRRRRRRRWRRRGLHPPLGAPQVCIRRLWAWFVMQYIFKLPLESHLSVIGTLMIANLCIFQWH